MATADFNFEKYAPASPEFKQKIGRGGFGSTTVHVADSSSF